MVRISGESLLGVQYEVTQKSVAFASSIAERFTGVDAVRLAQEMGEAAVHYYSRLLDPPEPNRRAELKAILDVAFKARELRQTIENCGPLSQEVVIHELEKTPSGSYQSFTDSDTWRWLERLSNEVPIWADYFERAPAEPGRSTLIHWWTEGQLLRDCEKMLLPIATLTKDQRRSLAPKIAREIHYFVTGNRQPQKFRKTKGEMGKL